jgi:catechol 2,3-dioxygenase-like lactoylglutathione lyase family enzyme
MMKFDHLALPVSNLDRSREWYIATLGLKVEFEIPLWFQVDDVDKAFGEWTARGVAFAHPPQKNFWGYGPELVDPDGYIVRLWDERTMKEK